MNPPRIALFADGGDDVGMGHMFRLYPVFHCLQDMGVAAEMWTPLAQAELDRIRLTGVRTAPKEPEGIAAVLSQAVPDMVVLDTYRHLRPLCEMIEGRGCRLALFDDHFRVDRRVALIVNSSPVVKAVDYAPGLAEQFLLGPAYASIFAGFVQARSRYAVSGNPSRILVALGGADVCSNLSPLLGTLMPLLRPGTDVCVLSAGSVAVDPPEGVALECSWLTQEGLAQRLPDFDLAVLAGGSMLWQTACVGVPTLSWPQTEGQKRHVAAWEEKGALCSISKLDELPAAFERLQSIELRMRLSSAGRSLVDGLGAGRIASGLKEMAGCV